MDPGIVDGPARRELTAFLADALPATLPLDRYLPFALPVAVSFLPGAGVAPGADLDLVAARVTRIFELAFAPEDPGWLAVLLWDDDADGLETLRGCLPPEAAAAAEIGAGRTADGWAYTDVVVAVRPRDADHRRLVRAVVQGAFPVPGVPRLHATLIAVNRARGLVLDLPDDRYCGVAAAGPEPLRAIYASGAAPLNPHRRARMQMAFGGWPEA